MSRKRKNSDHKEFVLRGVAASTGIAIGRGYVYKKSKPEVRNDPIDSSEVSKHVELFDEAKDLIEAELLRLKKKEIDGTAIEILQAQIEIVNDPELEAQVKDLIREKKFSADFAVKQVFDAYLEMLDRNSNTISSERMVDLRDIRDRLIQIATNHSREMDIRPESIVVAENISPREVMEFADYKISALVTDHGGQTSHASILARSMGIPSVVGAKRACKLIGESCDLIVDGNDGMVIIDPGESMLEEFREKIKKQEIEEEKLRHIVSKPAATKDGVAFKLRANIEFLEELPNINKYGAEGVGLLRTESIYIRKEHFEDREKQGAFYSEILKKTDPAPVTIRLFDAGGDKFFSMSAKENNPFLGWRGIRMLLDERDLLREQLRAILRVAAEYPGRIKILVPMISVLNEVMEIKKEFLSVQEELEQKGTSIDKSVELGIMVEVPSVAIKAEEFAKHVDFFSVGSNDLTQYTLAVDRGNELISNLYQQIHPAVFELINNCVKAARKSDIEIAVCGEMASYPKAAACLVGLGITDLSMSPASIPKVKNILRNHTAKQMQNLAKSVLQAATISEVNELLNEQ